jgi:hypothetical protein
MFFASLRRMDYRLGTEFWDNLSRILLNPEATVLAQMEDEVWGSISLY